MRRLHVPTMKREILYIILKPAVIDGQTKDGVFKPTEAELEDWDALKRNLMSPWVDNTGFHFIISPEGKVFADIIPQRPGEASPGYNADAIIIGCVALRDGDGRICQQATLKQLHVAKGVVRILKSIFPKATFKLGNTYVMGCKAEDIYDPSKEEEEEV